jgi:hypothetical protein
MRDRREKEQQRRLELLDMMDSAVKALRAELGAGEDVGPDARD